MSSVICTDLGCSILILFIRHTLISIKRWLLPEQIILLAHHNNHILLPGVNFNIWICERAELHTLCVLEEIEEKYEYDDENGWIACTKCWCSVWTFTCMMKRFHAPPAPLLILFPPPPCQITPGCILPPNFAAQLTFWGIIMLVHPGLAPHLRGDWLISGRWIVTILGPPSVPHSPF